MGWSCFCCPGFMIRYSTRWDDSCVILKTDTFGWDIKLGTLTKRFLDEAENDGLNGNAKHGCLIDYIGEFIIHKLDGEVLSEGNQLHILVGDLCRFCLFLSYLWREGIFLNINLKFPVV